MSDLEFTTTKASPWPVAQTVQRLTDEIAQRGATVFTTIDQAAAARQAGTELRDTVLIVFGNPAAGTALMEAVPLAALDLPLKLLVWDDAGATQVSYVTPAALADRYALSGPLAAPLGAVQAITAAVLGE